MWEVSKEQEEKFRNGIDYDDDELEELFKLIRGAEYRRGKEDGRKEYQENENEGEK